MSDSGIVGASACGALASIATITVTYNPDIEILREQLGQLPEQCLKVLVDNASAPELLAAVRGLAAGRDDVLLVENPGNVGLATALNQGARHAQDAERGCVYLVLLDQDTEPGPGGIEALFDGYRQLARSHPRLACVGPRLVDVQTGLDHGFHQIARWGWVRRFMQDGPPVCVANLNGSGTLMSVDTFNRFGGLRDEFFIDHVDTEWAFRVQAAGYQLFGLPGVAFRHRMGEAGIRFWLLGWRVWHQRSPARHFFLFRNTVRLLRTPHVPWVWKVWAPLKLAAALLVHLVFDRQRRAQATQMFRGLRAGFSESPAAISRPFH